MWAVVLMLAGLHAFIIGQYDRCIGLISLALLFAWLTRDLSGWRE